jgi:hypothetical protein
MIIRLVGAGGEISDSFGSDYTGECYLRSNAM